LEWSLSREDRLIKERIETEPIKVPILTIDHISYIKDTVIEVLRDVFSRDPDYTYIKGPDGILPAFDHPNLGIVITDVFSYEVEFLPAVTVRINSSNLVPVSFNQNQYTYNYARDPKTGALIPVWQEFSGLYDTSVTLIIHTWDPMAREQLVQRIAILFKHLLRDQLYVDFGVHVKAVSVGGETETELQGNDELMIFSQPITVEVITGWNNRLPVGENLEAINFQIMGVEGVPPNDKVEWVDEIRTCPELVLIDALQWNVTQNQFVLTDDWYQILTVNCGVTVEEAQVQINSGSSLREALVQAAASYRERAHTLRNNKKSAFKSGSPSTGFRYRFSDGTTIAEDDTVTFLDGIIVQGDDTAFFPASNVKVDEQGNVIQTEPNVNIDAWTNPFTATTLQELDVFQFFLILLDVNSVARQSPTGLNELIDNFVSTLTDVGQIAAIEGVRANVNDYLKNRFLLNKTGPV
jgi:hypothetical protein